MTLRRYNENNDCSPPETAVFCCIAGGAVASAGGCVATGAEIYFNLIPTDVVVASGGASQMMAQACIVASVLAAPFSAVAGLFCNGPLNRWLLNPPPSEIEQDSANIPSSSVSRATAPVPQTMGKNY